MNSNLKTAIIITATALSFFCSCARNHVAVCPAIDNKQRKDSLNKVIKGLSIDQLNEQIAQFRAEGDSMGVAVSYILIGKRYYHNENDYMNSIAAYRMAAPAIAATGDTIMYINNLNLLSTNCRRIGSYSAASDYLYEALNMAECYSGCDSPEGIRMRSTLLNGIGNVYKYLNNGREAETFFRRSIELDMQIGNNIGLAKNYSTLGSVYEYRNDIDSVRMMYQKALEYDIIASSQSGIAICHNKLGQLDMNQNRIDEALRHHLAAYEILKKERDDWDLLKAGLSIAWIYIVKGNISGAMQLLDESERLARGLHSYGYLEEIHYDRAEIYRGQGRYREAYDQQALCLIYRDSISMQKDEQEVAQNRIRYEREQSNMVIGRIEAEKEHVEANNRLIIISMVLGGCVMFMLLTTAFMFIRLQRRRNRELSEINAMKSRLFSIISHDLKNPVIAQRQTLELLVANFDSLPIETSYQQCNALLESSRTLLDLLYNLLAWSRLQSGHIQFNPTDFPIIDAVREIKGVVGIQAAAKDIDIETNVPEDAIACADRNMIETVLRNLTSNAIKFSNKGSKIRIIVEEQRKSYVVKVADEGVGMSAATVASLFRIDSKPSTAGTAGETGSGLGLIISKEMIECNGGHLLVESREGIGTTISFKVKKG